MGDDERGEYLYKFSEVKDKVQFVAIIFYY